MPKKSIDNDEILNQLKSVFAYVDETKKRRYNKNPDVWTEEYKKQRVAKMKEKKELALDKSKETRAKQKKEREIQKVKEMMQKYGLAEPKEAEPKEDEQPVIKIDENKKMQAECCTKNHQRKDTPTTPPITRLGMDTEGNTSKPKQKPEVEVELELPPTKDPNIMKREKYMNYLKKKGFI